MEIKRYSQFVNHVNESVSLTDNMAFLENEYLRMVSEGLTEEKINENIFGSLLGSLGGGFSDTFKDYIVDWAAEKLGIIPFDEKGRPTFFYQLVRNVIEGVHFTEMGKYFGKGSCKNWSSAIVKGLAETLEERGIEYLLPALGVRIDMNTGLGGTLAASLREAATNALNNTEFADKIERMISDKICNFGIKDIFSSGGVSSADKQKLSAEVERAGEKDPSIFTKLMKTGLSDVIR